MEWKRATRLRPGDTVGIVSPSGTPAAEAVRTGIEFLERSGFRTVLAPHVCDAWGHFAGPDATRAADLNRLDADEGRLTILEPALVE